MEFIQELKKMERLHQMVKKRATGPIDVIARKLGISISCAHRLLEQLEQFGQPIRYDARVQTFSYIYGFHSKVDITIATVSDNMKIPYTTSTGQLIHKHSFSFS
ncbi:hypothetical protein [Croceitalea sp. MTPC5]|uniref:hypothetical protein n=1 Tax=Croceitalea sp. MTPC5 TaxID=3056565 RepID=UPI0030CB90A3